MNSAPYRAIARVLEVHHQPEGYLDLLLVQADIARIAQPGQFVMIRSWPGDDPFLPRPFDIVAADPTKGTLRLVLKITGRGTVLLESLQAGDRITVTGPLGREVEIGGSSVGFLVRGAGAAAVVFPAQKAHRLGIPVYTFLSAAKASRLICRDDLQAVSTHLEIATDDGSAGYQGNATDLLDRFLEQRSIDQLYSCGSRRFARHVKQLDTNERCRGYVFLEGYMACGLGDCHGCAVQKASGEGYHLVCTDGPHFPVREVVLP